ncbi:Hypothetical Protein FCC1311_112482 [Hondaea fermentalgiana]|uniref:Uncharacterized protein n=1 Tax=Hondaea fermentalgiana TaxID=2315210 RepID=A0A2R5GWR9_9STRA|nr:Hypothetical Protein FCC1311_112482 [Hondaea fermentalgiana]|eukprot:GBG35025.1 Hypothetical Protein FCC1311_112482 [Hondaea fermentalgiana]
MMEVRCPEPTVKFIQKESTRKAWNVRVEDNLLLEKLHVFKGSAKVPVPFHFESRAVFARIVEEDSISINADAADQSGSGSDTRTLRELNALLSDHLEWFEDSGAFKNVFETFWMNGCIHVSGARVVCSFDNWNDMEAFRKV